MTARAQALVSRVNLGSLPLRDALLETMDLYREDPLFCIPLAVRDTVAQLGRHTRFVLLGARTFAEVFIKALRDNNRILHVVDDFQCGHGKVFHGVPIASTEAFLSAARSDPSIVAINCCRSGYPRLFFDDLCFRYGIGHLNHEQVVRLLALNDAADYRTSDWAPTIDARFDEYLALEHRLSDTHSVATLLSLLMFQLTCNPEWYLGVARPYSTLYFRSGLLPLSDREKFVDCGASIGESTSALIGITGGKIAHSWMIEPDRLNIEVLRRLQQKYEGTALDGRISLHPFAVGESMSEAPFHHLGGHGSSISVDPDAPLETVSILPIDSILDDAPTFIKMDIEGFELSALRGAACAIRASTPKLAISAYHRASDLVDLPAFIDSIAPGYSLGLQHHTEDRWDTCLYFYR